MRPRVWPGAMAGATAALAMLACALGLTQLGQRCCLLPWLAVTHATLAHDLHGGVMPLVALAPGVALHAGAAAAVGVLGTCGLARWPRPLATAAYLLGGGLSMGCFDAALLALRSPVMSLMLDGPQVLEYAVFGLVLGAVTQARIPPVAAQRFMSALNSVPSVRGPWDPAGAVPRPRSMEVVVAPHCFGCARARALAAKVAARFPHLEVRIVDLNEPDTPAPPGIVAIPAYVLDGHLLFTGNPTPEALFRALGHDGDAGG